MLLSSWDDFIVWPVKLSDDLGATINLIKLWFPTFLDSIDIELDILRADLTWSTRLLFESDRNSERDAIISLIGEEEGMPNRTTSMSEWWEV